jgi:hypothetical protein
MAVMFPKDHQLHQNYAVSASGGPSDITPADISIGPHIAASVTISASGPSGQYWTTDNNTSFLDLTENEQPTELHTLKGQLVSTQLTHSEMDKIAYNGANFEDYVKNKLALELVMVLEQSKSIQFTKSEDYSTGMTTYRAYLYVTPKEQTEIVRIIKANSDKNKLKGLKVSV